MRHNKTHNKISLRAPAPGSVANALKDRGSLYADSKKTHLQGGIAVIPAMAGRLWTRSLSPDTKSGAQGNQTRWVYPSGYAHKSPRVFASLSRLWNHATVDDLPQFQISVLINVSFLGNDLVVDPDEWGPRPSPQLILFLISLKKSEKYCASTKLEEKEETEENYTLLCVWTECNRKPNDRVKPNCSKLDKGSFQLIS